MMSLQAPVGCPSMILRIEAHNRDGIVALSRLLLRET